MAHIEFTSQLAQLVDCPASQSVDGSSLGEMLEAVFVDHPELRQHVLDEDGSVHSHLAVFVDGEMLPQRDQLDRKLSSNSEVFVMQALSGG